MLQVKPASICRPATGSIVPRNITSISSHAVSRPVQRSRWTPARRVHVPRAAAAGADSASDDEAAPAPGSAAWRNRPAAIALPASLRSPGVWFVLAGFMKVAALTMTMGTYPFGGLGDLLVVLPVAIGLSLFAKWVVDNDLMKKKWYARAIVFGMLLFLYLSGLAYSSSTRKQYESRRAAEPPTARVAAEPQQRPAPRRLPTARDAEAMGVKWEKPVREWRKTKD